MTEVQNLQNIIEKAWDNRELVKEAETQKAIQSLIEKSG